MSPKVRPAEVGRRHDRSSSPSRRLAARCAQIGGDTPERASCDRVERKRNEIGLGLLLVRLPRRTLRAAGNHGRADRQLGERDGRDRGFVRRER